MGKIEGVEKGYGALVKQQSGSVKRAVKLAVEFQLAEPILLEERIVTEDKFEVSSSAMYEVEAEH